MAIIKPAIHCEDRDEYERTLAFAEAAPDLVDVHGDPDLLIVYTTSAPALPWTPPEEPQ